MIVSPTIVIDFHTLLKKTYCFRELDSLFSVKGNIEFIFDQFSSMLRFKRISESSSSKEFLEFDHVSNIVILNVGQLIGRLLVFSHY